MKAFISRDPEVQVGRELTGKHSANICSEISQTDGSGVAVGVGVTVGVGVLVGVAVGVGVAVTVGVDVAVTVAGINPCTHVRAAGTPQIVSITNDTTTNKSATTIPLRHATLVKNQGRKSLTLRFISTSFLFLSRRDEGGFPLRGLI